jgi:hypothetical protein
MRQGDYRNMDILDFDKKAGRKELARQLTLLVSGLYRLVDHEQAVTNWQEGKYSR